MKYFYLPLVLLISLFSTSNSHAATDLDVGDIAFLSFNLDGVDEFSFILLKDIDATTTINFTDCGWNDGSPGGFNCTTGDSPQFTWTSGAARSCGDVIVIRVNNPGLFTATGSLSGTTPVFSGLGDQLFAFQGTTGSPEFLAGMQSNEAPVASTDANWSGSSTNNQTSALPDALTNGMTAIRLHNSGGEIDNWAYDCSTVSGTAAAIRAEIYDIANWNFSNTTVQAANCTWTVTCPAACNEPDVPTVNHGPPIICSGNSALLTWTGDLNDATAWHVYSTSCGVGAVGTTTGNSIIVTPPASGSITYFVRGEGGCSSPSTSTCGSHTINITARENAAFSYSSSTYCVNDADPTPTITGVMGGDFSSSPSLGAALNTSTGQIDLSGVTPGMYTIEYETPGLCSGTETQMITITGVDNTAFSYSAAEYCPGGSDPTPTITGVMGGMFSSMPAGLSINAMSGQIDVSASTEGTYTVTYATTGSCAGSTNVMVAVQDTTPPTAVCQNVTVYLDGSGNASITAGDVNNGSTDNCSLAGLSVSPSSFTCANVGTNNVTLTATDASGNSSTCMAVVTVSDTTSPTAVCQNVTVFLDGSGNASITAGDVNNGSSDNCSVAGLSVSPSSFTCANVGANNVTLTVTDAAGNSSSCMAVVTVSDTTSPTAVCQNVTVYLNGSGNASISTGDINNGSSDNCSLASLGLNQSSFTCANVGANNVTLTVTDANSNTSTCTAVVTVLDTISPTAVCQNVTVFLDGSGNASITTGDINNGSSDNCSLASLGLNQSSFTCADIGSNNVTLTVTDANSNTSTCMATVTVADTTSPTAVCQNVTVHLDGSGNASITTGDIDGGSTDNCSVASLSLSQSSFTCSNVGANNVTLTVTDAAGNSSTCVAVVTVADTTSPTAVCQNVTVFLDGSGNASISTGDINNGSSDNCSLASLGLNQSSFTCADIGMNNVTLTVTDANGNMSTCMATVTVQDTTGPAITCPANQTIFAGASCMTTLPDYTSMATAMDNCGGAVSVTQSPMPGATITGNTTVTLTATDGGSNSSSCQFNVMFSDTTSPTAFCQNITVFLNGAGNATITAADIDGGSSDNCGSVSLSASQTTFTCADLGMNFVTLTADDGNGNMSTCVAVVTVSDTISPTAVCQNITAFLDGTGNVTITAADIDGGSSDNCSIASMGLSQSSFTCADLGMNFVTLTVNDGSGNMSTCVAVVTVSDTVSPTALCQNITVFLDGSGNTTITAADIDGGSSDNCGPVSLSASTTAFTCANIGTNNVTLTVNDGNGNMSTCVAVVTVSDTVSPTVVCQNVTAYLDGSGNATVAASALDNGSADNCGSVSFMASQTAFTCANIGANSVTLTVNDGNGNTATCMATVTILDSLAPVVTCPGNQVENFDASCQFTLPDYTPLGGVTDNCGGSLMITQTPTPGTVISGNTTITFTSIDASGNAGTCTFDVVPNDATPPIISCPGNQTGIVAANCMFMVPDYTGMATATDNCGTPTVSQSPTAGSMVPAGMHTVTLTASDGVNTVNCSFTLTVTGPVASFTQDVTSGCNELEVTFTDASTNAVAWSWNFGDGNTSMDQNPVHTFSDTGSYDVTLTVTSAAGCQNVTMIVDAVTVLPPVANFAANPTTGCTIPHTVFFTDQSTLPDTWFWDFGDMNTSTLQNPVHNYTAFGTFNVTLTVTDTINGCSDTATAVIVVNDMVPPAITCPGNQTEFANASCMAALGDYTSLASATDMCDPSPVITQSPAAGTMFSGTQTVLLIATDDAGNADTCMIDVSIMDTISPTISCPAPITVYTDASCVALVGDYTGMATTSDNCDMSPTVAQSPAAGTMLTNVAGSMQAITLTVTDAAGNVDSCTFNLMVADTISPTIVCPADASIFVDSSCDVSLPDYTGMVMVGDNCSSLLTVTQSPAPGTTISGAGTVTAVTLIAGDAFGNVDSCSFNVTAVDTIVPQITCVADQDLYVDASCDVSLPDYTGMATATDNCTMSPTVTQSPAAGTTLNGAGTTQTVTLFATDASGNVDSCSFTVTLNDSIIPTIACPATDTIYADASCVAMLGDYTGMATVADNCDATPVVTQSPVAGTMITSMAGTTQVVTLTVTDASGNVDSCSFDVFIGDSIAPTVMCPADDAIYVDVVCEATLGDYTMAATTSDNCGGTVTVTQMPAAGTVVGAGVTTVTLTATDTFGNASTCTFDVTALDSIAPMIVCALDTVTCDSNFVFNLPTATDNCGIDTIIQIAGVMNGMVYPLGVTTNTFVATDLSGNTDTCSFTVELLATPLPANAGFDFTVCDTNAITLNASTLGAGETGAWLALNGGTITSANTETTTVTGLTAGTTYSFVWAVTNGICGSADTVNVSVQPDPDATFTFVNNSSSIIVTANNTSPTATYEWDFGGLGISNEQVDTFLFATPGTFDICLTVTDNGCVSTTCLPVDITTSVVELDQQTLFNVFPNPYRGETNITFSLKQAASVDLEVWDLSGRKVAALANGTYGAGDYRYTFDAANYARGKGVYVVRLRVDDQYYNIRVIELD